MRKIEENNFSLNNSVVRINEIFKKLGDMIELTAKLKGLFINIQVNLPYKINVDYKRLLQVLLNLTSNAIKFTFKGGVTITTTENLDTGILEIIISDTGVGINSGELDQIFNMFSQVETKLSESKTGKNSKIILYYRNWHWIKYNKAYNKGNERGN